MLVDLTLSLATPQGRDPRVAFDDAIALAVQADRADFAGLWISENHFQGDYSKTSCPEMLLAALARETKSLQLGLGMFPMPLHDPLRIAERLATLDMLSGGRAIWCVGRGIAPAELKGFGQDYEGGRTRMIEGLGELRNILMRGEVERFGIREPVAPLPDTRLVRGWMACVSTPTFDLAADLGMDAQCGPYEPWPIASLNLQRYRERFPQGQTAFTIGAFVHEDRAEARRIAGPGLAWAFRHILEGSAPVVKAQVETQDSLAALRWMVPMIERPMSLPALEALGLAVVGTPDDLLRHLERLAASGLTRVSMMLGGGDVAQAQLLAACELIGARVLPHFTEPRIAPTQILA
ncbi:MAG: LLM class flavin-dependent oxidoreductase [Alphaproteobacteria bacterium]|nr:LLM class flavin-dependent oxidoreductase [Alphaproteobacteria bacterium]